MSCWAFACDAARMLARMHARNKNTTVNRSIPNSKAQARRLDAKLRSLRRLLAHDRRRDRNNVVIPEIYRLFLFGLCSRREGQSYDHKADCAPARSMRVLRIWTRCLCATHVTTSDVHGVIACYVLQAST